MLQCWSRSTMNPMAFHGESPVIQATAAQTNGGLRSTIALRTYWLHPLRLSRPRTAASRRGAAVPCTATTTTAKELRSSSSKRCLSI